MTLSVSRDDHGRVMQVRYASEARIFLWGRPCARADTGRRPSRTSISMIPSSKRVICVHAAEGREANARAPAVPVAYVGEQITPSGLVLKATSAIFGNPFRGRRCLRRSAFRACGNKSVDRRGGLPPDALLVRIPRIVIPLASPFQARCRPPCPFTLGIVSSRRLPVAVS